MGVRGTAVEYSITPLGATLRELLLALQEWAKVHMAEVEAARARFDARERSDDNQPNDLFRVDNGKIADHWDTIEEIPARGAWKNDDGKF